ncbi:hypothetical protein C5167_030320 [Papaver somniferum]|uniref:CRM-domain containing factor CFM3, chloroplastic/mitochondrial-like n=1 Tax=Papaver somniferum TaxID=3469 RepID=UPI000E6FBFD9|nr:CRM-domain containing factor CFM3, chloroplastic/mitochondrial-like [Papaver somniferum]XP_026432584.1 CRM-domain containing factor CFM3, chloroplastic/mitochondrial-like [Papaver somniferum]XP_026432585.1 CRM-domain containing factor CFM3, chloroplastic/mitochondrial-like [Papaver somniferum]RZC86972.1 hypothetical protein C5167_030320 [Papaver somniferum]
MATGSLLRALQRATRTSSTLNFSFSNPYFSRSISYHTELISSPSQYLVQLNPWKPTWVFRNFSHGRINFVTSQGKSKFEEHEYDQEKRQYKSKWICKKKFKMQLSRGKTKRKLANKKDPRNLRVIGKKQQKFLNAEERIIDKIDKAKIKEALLMEKLKRYEVPKAQGPEVKQECLTGEERFYMKKMARKGSNYLQVGVRGVYGGVIDNMHMHWKHHETVKVFCKPCRPGEVHEYAKEIARLSGGIPIQVIGNDTIVFYRGKNYVQPDIRRPVDTLSKKRALEKSKYMQSLEAVRHFIAVAEKELELQHRHVALCNGLSSYDLISISTEKDSAFPVSSEVTTEGLISHFDDFSIIPSDIELDHSHQELLQTEEETSESNDEYLSGSEVDVGDGSMSVTNVSSDKEEVSFFKFSLSKGSFCSSAISPTVESRFNFYIRDLHRERSTNS